MNVMLECYQIAHAEGIHVHIDGARCFLALAESKYEPSDLMKCCDSFTICLSKGLLAPVGSLVVGSH